jgi:3-oxoacyl-[acyl-carrier-protein] synthase-3
LKQKEVNIIMYQVGIVGTGSYLPEKVLTNADLEKIVDTSDDWIVSRTGIRERRIADQDTPVSELCYQAAVRALESARITPAEVDLIIVTTITPDYIFPATSCLVADRLGASKAAAFDLGAGCTGFIYGITAASQFISTGLYRTVLVIGADALTKLLNWEDRNTCILFGDGAGAVVLRSVEKDYGFLSFELGSDGSGAELLYVPAGGLKTPVTAENLAQKLNTIHMTGREVFKFAVKIMGETSIKALERAGLKKEDVDLLIPHQANLRIVGAAVRRLGISPDRVVVNLDRYGNMSAASVPVALDEAVKAGRIARGDIVVMVGFGAGLTWGAAVLKWAMRGALE